MNPKIAKFAIKSALSIGVATLLGYMIKLENRIEDKIDERYESNNEDPKTDQ